MNKMNITRREFLKKSLASGAAATVAVSFPKSLFAQAKKSSIIKTIDGLKGPYGISFGPDDTLWVTDAANYCVMIYTKTGSKMGRFGGPGSSGGKFNYPQGIFVEDGHAYVMDSNNGRIAIFDMNLKLKSTIGNIGGYPEAFYTPKGIFVSDRIYACNTRNHFVSVFDKSTHKLVAKLGNLGDDPIDLQKGSTEYRFRLPTDVAVDAEGKIYVVDSKHGLVKVLDKEGKFLYKFGSIGSEPGQLNFPEGICLDSNKDIYVCDTLNGRIQKFDQQGKLLGIFQQGLKRPTSLIIDDDNTLYIVDNALKQVIIAKWEA